MPHSRVAPRRRLKVNKPEADGDGGEQQHMLTRQAARQRRQGRQKAEDALPEGGPSLVKGRQQQLARQAMHHRRLPPKRGKEEPAKARPARLPRTPPEAGVMCSIAGRRRHKWPVAQRKAALYAAIVRRAARQRPSRRCCQAEA